MCIYGVSLVVQVYVVLFELHWVNYSYDLIYFMDYFLIPIKLDLDLVGIGCTSILYLEL